VQLQISGLPAVTRAGNGQWIINRRSIAETAMYRVKQLLGGSLTLRDYDGQVAEAMAMVRENDEGWYARKRAYYLTTATG